MADKLDYLVLREIIGDIRDLQSAFGYGMAQELKDHFRKGWKLRHAVNSAEKYKWTKNELMRILREKED